MLDHICRVSEHVDYARDPFKWTMLAVLASDGQMMRLRHDLYVGAMSHAGKMAKRRHSLAYDPITRFYNSNVMNQIFDLGWYTSPYNYK